MPKTDGTASTSPPRARRPKVLVIDDERDLVELVRYNLERDGFEVFGAPDGESGLALALQRSPDVILLDRMMPGPDGLELCRRLRQDERTAQVPVILLTAKAAEADRVTGLDAGADDYVTKPFSPRELAARVRARLRRPAVLAGVPSQVRNGDLVIDEVLGEVTYGGRPVELTTAEFRILQFLAGCPGRVMFRRTTPQGDLLLGRLAVRQRLVTEAQLREVVAVQERDAGRRVGELLVERFYLAPRDLERLLGNQRAAFGGSDESSNGLLGRLLVEKGLATEYQVNGALRLQGRFLEAGIAPAPPLGEILVRRGWLEREALATALQLQKFMLYRCPQCGARIGLRPGTRPAPSICPDCSAEIPALFAKMAAAIHQVLEEAAGAHAVSVPEDVLDAAEDPGRQFGKYVLLNLLGRGGAGEVYRAWQRDANRVVALKLLPRATTDAGPRTPFGHPEAVKRFFSEARAIADAEHPNIVPIYDYGTAEGCFYYAMAFVEGVSLEQRLRQGDLSLRKRLAILRDVAFAVDAAHAQGICHRDLKPGNILVDREGRPWVIDFGLARVARIGDSAYEKGIICGTPYYMPPEQALGDMELVDELSDVYSLGAILYEIVAGRCPYSDLDPHGATSALTGRPPAPVEEAAPTASGELHRIVRRAMARDKGGRYPRARDLAEDLQRFLDQEGAR